MGNSVGLRLGLQTSEVSALAGFLSFFVVAVLDRRADSEAPIRQGRLDCPWDRVVGGLVLGSKEFASRMLMTPDARHADDKAEGAASNVRILRPDWTSIVKAAERITRQRWSETVTAHGNWVRDAVLFTAVRHLGYRLTEVYREIGGLKYPAAATAVKRFAQMQSVEWERVRFVEALQRALKR